MLSTRLTLILEGLSVLLISILTVVILVKGGASGHLTVQPFLPGTQPFSNIGLAAVFGFLSFAGFEGAATLGEETRNPRRNIPIAILAAVGGTGIFYIIVMYAQTIGFGTGAAGITAFSSSQAPLGDLSLRYVGSVMSTLINLGATISAFASALATANAGSRMLFSMGRDGFITERLGTTSHRTGSPFIALIVVMVVAFITLLVWSLAAGVDGITLFGYLGTIGVLLLLVAYILTNIGAIRFFVSRHLWTWQWIIPVAAIVVLGYTLYSNLYPLPAPPAIAFPYVALIWLLVGLAITLFNPTLVKRIGEHFKESEGLRLEEHAGPVPATPADIASDDVEVVVLASEVSDESISEGVADEASEEVVEPEAATEEVENPSEEAAEEVVEPEAATEEVENPSEGVEKQ